MNLNDVIVLAYLVYQSGVLNFVCLWDEYIVNKAKYVL